ncbi:MAG: trypsin-like peptidase domain-containing protein [Bdellovibrionales bacterium]|jgi:hypothetical protein|nr:trypsin-like peptidase domain-containing protein [Bdellovibrionales bacterium]
MSEVLVKTLKVTSVLALVLSFTAPAFGSGTTGPGRKVADPKGKYAKLAGQITQLDSHLPGKRAWSGNAFVIGSEGCFLMTNFHVAFDTGENDPVSGMGIVRGDYDVGHKVNFNFDLNARTGKFDRQVKATVVEFGNHGDANGDIAILRLDECLGKEYGHLELVSYTRGTPKGRIMTVSSAKTADQKGNVINIEEGCRAQANPAGADMLALFCEVERGMSGSMVLEEQADGEWKLVGLMKSMGGDRLAFAIGPHNVSTFATAVAGMTSGTEAAAGLLGPVDSKETTSDEITDRRSRAVVR